MVKVTSGLHSITPWKRVVGRKVGNIFLKNTSLLDYLPTGFSQTRPSAIEVQGLAFKPATAALSRYAQNPESLGSPGSHCSVVFVNGDMSSHPQ